VRLKVWIDRIKADCPAFAGRVGGMAAFIAAAADGARVAVPAAFVMRLQEVVEGSALTGGGTQQPAEETFGVMVCVAVSDREGVGADDAMEDIKLALLAALKGWEIDPAAGLVEYRGYETVDLTPARLWRRFDFSVLSGDAGTV
jgi:hypothetical protein